MRRYALRGGAAPSQTADTGHRPPCSSPVGALRLLLLVVALACSGQSASARQFTQLNDDPPDAIVLMLQLPDGTVMAANKPSGAYGRAWYRLTPDSQGSYQNGTWTTLASMTDTRLWYASQVLADGRVLVAGGEYGSGGSAAEIYSPPPVNSWSTLTIPAGLLTTGMFMDGTNKGFRDPMSEMLPDGRVIISPVVPITNNVTIIFDPTTNTFSAGPVSLGDQNEASWVKLPDDSILTVDKSTTNSERFIPALNMWVDDADVPVSLFDPFGHELGAAFLLPDGRAFFLGATGHTALYTPSGNNNPGSWAAGPDIPDSQATPDAGAAMMVNGKMLCAVSPLPTDAEHFPTPTSYYEYDYLANSFTRVNGPTGLTDNHECYKSLMLVLPDGNVLYSHFGTDVYVYSPGGSPLAAGKPRIHNITPNVDGTFHLTGTLLNGISEGANYGDDAQMNTNYPLVRLRDGGGNVFYATTFGWSSTGVATGNRVLSTEFRLPAGLPPGPYSLVVVANGIASDPFVCPADINQGTDLNACGANISWTVGAPGTTSVCRIGATVITSPHFFPVGDTTVTCTFPDNSTCSFHVNIFDSQDPTINCPANVVAANDPGVCGRSVTFSAPAADNCSTVTVVCRIGAQAITSPHLFPVGLTNVTCTATDTAGNTDECSFSVRIDDTEPPVVTATDAVVALDEYGNATVTPATFNASATDNCLAPNCPVPLTLSQSVFLCPPVNVPIPVTVFGTDCHNNVGSRTVTITFPDPDCNENGLPDICDILSGRSKDCDHNRVPDECQCVWDGGDPPANIAAVNGQISHLGGGSGDGAKVADDMYLEPGIVFQLFEFKGQMLTDLIPELRKARLELYEDCDGHPTGEPIRVFENPTATQDAGPNADGFYLVTYTFDMCDLSVWLDGGKTYWWSLIGLGTCDGLDLSSWVASTSPVGGSPPVKADGQPPVHCYATSFGEWRSLDACCIGCVNMAYKVVGQACPIIWDNGPALLSGDPGAGGISSENISPILRPRGADDFVIKPCEDQQICLIDAWVWSNCNPVQGFVEIYRNDCRVPGVLFATLTHPEIIETGESLLIGGALRQGYILRFTDLNLTLPRGQTYWLSAAADRTGSQNARTYFAFGGRCNTCPRHGYASQTFTPPAPVTWHSVGPDLAFRIAGAPPVEETPPVVVEPPPPATCAADINHSGAVTVQDIYDFLAAFFGGCP